MSYLYRGHFIDASYQVSVHLAEGFQWRRLKCEKLTDNRRRTPSDGKSSHYLWQGKKCLPKEKKPGLIQHHLQQFNRINTINRISQRARRDHLIDVCIFNHQETITVPNTQQMCCLNYSTFYTTSKWVQWSYSLYPGPTWSNLDRES